MHPLLNYIRLPGVCVTPWNICWQQHWEVGVGCVKGRKGLHLKDLRGETFQFLPGFDIKDYEFVQFSSCKSFAFQHLFA